MLPTSHSQLKLFDKKFVIFALKEFRRCDKCKREYDIKYKVSAADNKPNSSRPVLLNCGHNICENCIYQHRYNLLCAVCQIPVEFEHTRWLKKSYELNFCLLGQLWNSHSFLTSESAGPAIQNSMLAEELFVQKCTECEQAPAIGICMQCKVNFCKRCFTSVHQNAKVLKKHKLSEFEMQTLHLQLPKEQFCKLHNRMCDRFCSDCQGIFCVHCVRNTHSTHRVNPLTIENAKHKDKIISFLEALKPTRENIRKAQKDTRVCENHLEDLASDVVLKLNEFFLELHNHLQLEERRIIDEFKNAAMSSQKAIFDAFTKLSDGQTILNNIRSSLEGYIHKPPNNFHINSVIELATMQLEEIPCQIQISQNEKNPFKFKKLKDIRKDISMSYEAFALDPKISIRILPMYGDIANSFEISSEKVHSSEHMSMTQHELMDNFRPNTMSNSSSSTIAIGKVKRVGRVTNIISPVHFFVQDNDIIAEIRLLLDKVDGDSCQIESVIVGEMYLVYHVADKAWFRGIVKEELKKTKQPNDSENILYKTFLIDYGIYEEFPRKWFRKLSDKFRLIPAGAVACGLLDISPNGQEWSSEARELMEEIIQNKPVQITIQDTTKTPWKVEATISNSEELISIREALIYTGLGIDASVSVPQKSLQFTGIKPTQVSKMKQRLSRPMLHTGEFFRVNITHVENPQHFFALRSSQLEELTILKNEMELEYSDKQSDTIYYAQPLMCCALLVEERWYRGCIEEINGPNSIRVRLVDDGRTVTVNWRRLHALKESFTVQQEFSIECSLADVQPLQENDYEWTETAIAEFVRMTSNPNIQMTISSSYQFRYQVILNALKKHLDMNIGAMLVKYNHALTTGECSALIESIRVPKHQIDKLLVSESQPKQQPTNSGTMTIRTLKRTPVQVIHINNPGEFYIHLVEHIPGILKFHQELQLAQEENLINEDSYENISWQLNHHCMVLTSINESAAAQWFRGVILDINSDDADDSYVVFLRDRGLTIPDIRRNQLAPIADLFDRICNAAILSHLACVQPTGGMETWSHSAIDEFIHNISTFESLGATIQGTMKNGSIPMVLWGMMTESNDPLAPCTTKYTNINNVLVSAGLAHLTEKIDLTRQLDKFIQAEIEHGQQTLQNWYDNFKKTLDDIPVCVSDMNEDEKSVISNYEIVDSIGDVTATEWLPAKPIEKTLFTAYPTFVDEEAIVYLHDADKHSLLATIRAKINQEFETQAPITRAIDEKWAIGQPCLARYHLDKSVYRAVIHRELKGKNYEVRFIDYGNIEACKESDLYRMTAFPNIPIQAVRFRIDGIKPRGGQSNFSTTVLDLIHGMIVDKLCSIRVINGEENKDIKRCSIRFDRNDLATYLIQNRFVNGANSKISNDSSKKKIKKGTQVEHWPAVTSECNIDEQSNNSEDELREFLKYQICDPTEDPVTKSPQSSPKKKNNAMFNPEEYKRMFEKMQSEKLYKSVTDADSENFPNCEGVADYDNDDDDDDDVVELEFSFRSNYWHVDNNSECAPPMLKSEVGSNFASFDPLDTSSLLSNFSGIEAFKAPQLPSSVKSFYCEVSYARSSTILHIFPRLSELEYRQFELARRIQDTIRKIPPLVLFETKTPCLARYSKDKLWYRAIIRSHNASMHKVKVFYIDFLNTEVVEEENVRKCPKDLLSWPLRTFEMKLFGLKPNPKIPEKVVKEAVKKCLNNRTLYAKIIRERGKMMEICLFKSKSDKEAPAYEDLIAQKYLCKE